MVYMEGGGDTKQRWERKRQVAALRAISKVRTTELACANNIFALQLL